MTFYRCYSVLAAALLCGGLACADPLAVNFQTAEIPLGPGTTDAFPTSLPVLLGGASDIGLPNFAGDTIFLKFRPDDLSDVEAINSLTFTVNFIDDEKDAGETVQVAYALPSTNIIFDTSGFTSLPVDSNKVPLPYSLTFTLTAGQLDLAIPGILDDGNFRVRVQRQTGDFVVTGASAEMDVTYFAAAPEPATFLLLLPAAGFAFFRRRRS